MVHTPHIFLGVVDDSRTRQRTVGDVYHFVVHGLELGEYDMDIFYRTLVSARGDIVVGLGDDKFCFAICFQGIKVKFNSLSAPFAKDVALNGYPLSKVPIEL